MLKLKDSLMLKAMIYTFSGNKVKGKHNQTTD